MVNTWVTDLTHFLDESGGLHPALTGPGRGLAEHMTSIVAAATSTRDEAVEVRCRRRPKRRACPGRLEYRLWADERITWECPKCGDNGVISNWQSTQWDHRAFRPVH